MHVCTDSTSVYTLIRKSFGGNGVRTYANSQGKNPLYRKNCPQRWIEPTMLHQTGQQAQHITNELFWPLVKLLKVQNKENQAGVQKPTRPWWGALCRWEAPRPKTDFSLSTANLKAFQAPVRQNCKQQQVSQRWEKMPQKRLFCSLERLHESWNFKIRISLFGSFQKAEFPYEVEKFHKAHSINKLTTCFPYDILLFAQ